MLLTSHTLPVARSHCISSKRARSRKEDERLSWVFFFFNTSVSIGLCYIAILQLCSHLKKVML